MQVEENKEFIHHFPHAGRCSGVSRKAGLQHTSGELVRQTAPLLLYMLIMTPYWLQYPLGQLGLAVPAVSPPDCAPSSSLSVGRGEEQKKALALCKHYSATTKTFLYYQHCFQHKSTIRPL